MARVFGILIVICLITQANGAVNINGTQVEYLVSSHTELEKVRLEQGWRFFLDREINLGFRDDIVWLKTKLDSCSIGDRVYLHIAYPLLDYIDVWFLKGGKVVKYFQTGDKYPFSYRPVPATDFYFPFDCKVEQVYLRVETTSSYQVPLSILGEKEFNTSSSIKDYGQFLYFGAVLVMAIYNFLIFLTVFKLPYLYYVCFALSYSLFQVGLSGIGFRFLWPDMNVINEYIMDKSIIGIVAFGGIFCDQYLNFREYAKGMHRIIRYLLVSIAIYFPISFILSYPVAIKFSILYVALMVTATVVGIILTVMHRRREAYIFLCAWITFLMAAFILAFNKLGLIPRNALTENSLQIASVMEMVLLSFGLADQLNILQKNLSLANAKLETTLASIEDVVREKTRDIRGVMRNIPQGIFTLAEDNTINEEYSKFLEEIIGEERLTGKNIDDLLFAHTRLSKDNRNSIRSVVENSVGNPRFTFDCNVHLLPKKLSFHHQDQEKLLELQWNTILDENEDVTKVIVSIRDVTQIRKLEDVARGKNRELDIVDQILNMQDDYVVFISQTKSQLNILFSLLKDNPDYSSEDFDRCLRILHTLKGTARMRGASFISDQIHEAETVFLDEQKNYGTGFDREKILETSLEVSRIVEEYELIFKGKLKRGGKVKVMLDHKSYTQLVRIFHQPSISPLLLEDLKQVVISIAKNRGAFLPAAVHSMVQDCSRNAAATLGILEPVLDINLPGIPVDTPLLRILESVIPHLVNNSLDHGIKHFLTHDSKEAVGRITVQGELVEGVLRLHFFDNGRGFDLIKLGDVPWPSDKKKAGELLLEMFCRPGFSTKSEADQVSGRGIGLAAVKQSLENCGGGLEVGLLDHSPHSSFQTFEFLILLPVYQES